MEVTWKPFAKYTFGAGLQVLLSMSASYKRSSWPHKVYTRLLVRLHMPRQRHHPIPFSICWFLLWHGFYMSCLLPSHSFSTSLTQFSAMSIQHFIIFQVVVNSLPIQFSNFLLNSTGFQIHLHLLYFLTNHQDRVSLMCIQSRFCVIITLIYGFNPLTPFPLSLVCYIYVFFFYSIKFHQRMCVFVLLT